MIFSIILIFCLGVIHGSYYGVYPRYARSKGRPTMTIKGSQCIIPFSFRGEVYRSCAPGINQPLPWCAISVKNDLSNVMDDWEICATYKHFSRYKGGKHLSPYSPYSPYPTYMDEVYQRRDLYYGRPYSGLDDAICTSLNRYRCASLAFKERCPRMCYAGIDDIICESLDYYDCKSQHIKRRCPKLCLAGIDDIICESLDYYDCKSQHIKIRCPKLCLADVCNLPVDEGSCKDELPRYYFNTKTGKCESFIYGGCGGNDNNFDRQVECIEMCKRIDLRAAKVLAFDDDSSEEEEVDLHNKLSPVLDDDSSEEEVVDLHNKLGSTLNDDSDADEILDLHNKSALTFDDDDLAADEVPDPHNMGNPYDMQKHLKITGFVPKSINRVEHNETHLGIL